MSSNTAESGTTAAVLEDIQQKCRELATTSPENTQKIAADLLGMGKAYYHDACMRAQQSFRVALGAAIVGIMFLFGASALVIAGKTGQPTYAVISGNVSGRRCGRGVVLASRQSNGSDSSTSVWNA